MESARAATRADLEAIQALAAAAEAEIRTKRWGSAFLRSDGRAGDAEGGPASLQTALDDPDELVVVGLIDEVIVGYGSLRLTEHADARRTATVRDLFVHPDARLVGVGEAMINVLVAHAHEQGCAGIDSYALPGDRATKNFFETNGFKARLLVVHSPLSETPEDAAPDA